MITEDRSPANALRVTGIQLTLTLQEAVAGINADDLDLIAASRQNASS